MEKVILDEDGGGDTWQNLVVLGSRPDKINLLGVTTAFGNVDHDTALTGNGSMLRFAGLGHIPYFPGMKIPASGALLAGDGAHGPDGKGGVVLPPPSSPPQERLSVDFILDTLRSEPEKSVTIIACAPQANLAAAITRDAATMRRIKKILIMGGCTTPIPAPMPADERQFRQGNITPQAEFNFYQDAAAARIVMASGLPIILFPMNATHALTLTPVRAQMIRDALPASRHDAETIIALMSAPAAIDRAKFNSAPVMHDIHTALYLLDPDLYGGRRGRVSVTVDDPQADLTRHGHSQFTPDPDGSTVVIEHVKDPDLLFGRYMNAVRNRFRQPCQPIQRPSPT